MDDLEVEQPQLITKCFKMLVEGRVRTEEQILDDIRLSADDVEELACFPKGFFSADPENDGLALRLKNEKVVPFRRDLG